MHWILDSSSEAIDEEVVRSLISVDVCFHQRITRRRSKKAIWRYLKDFYGRAKKRSAITGNNRDYLLENIRPDVDLIESLVSHNCITEEQRHIIQRQHSNRDKNAELLYATRYFDETKFSEFIKCLRQASQKMVARIIDNGGVVIKSEVQTTDAKCITPKETQLLYTKIQVLRNRFEPWSQQSNELMEEDIEILNSQMDRQTVVVWIWCRSQAAFEYIQKMHEMNQLRDVDLLSIYVQSPTSKTISIDMNQFKKAVVVYVVSISFNQRIEVPENEIVRGVAKLRNEIYILCPVIRIFEDRYPFRQQKEIEIMEIKSPCDIGSTDKDNCIYVSDLLEKCVWKLTKHRDDKPKPVKWLSTDHHPYSMSVSRDGQLLLVNVLSSILMIYGSDAELIRSILLCRDNEIPIHVVETSIGNFIILYEWMEKGEDREIRSSGGKRDTKWGIYELTRDGLMVINRFVPSDETQELNGPQYLSLHSDDRVLVADRGKGRLLLLDGDLMCIQLFQSPSKEEDEKKIRYPSRLCFDEEKKQLIVGGFLGGVNVYNLCRN